MKNFINVDDIEFKYSIKFDNCQNYVLLILQIFNNNITIVTSEFNYYHMHIYALYYQVNNDYNKMKHYYLLACGLNYPNSMHELANYYETIEVNYILMKKYYIMAAELNYTKSMNKLAYYYKTIEINYNLMNKYYSMSIKFNNIESIREFGNYYKYNNPNCKIMMKYYFKAIKLNDPGSMHELADYYHNNFEYELMIKYYLMAIKFKFGKSAHNLGNYYYYKSIYGKLIISTKKYILALKYYKIGIELNYVKSMYKLGYIYQQNNNINNINKIIEYYMMASQQNYLPGINALHSMINDDVKLFNILYESNIKSKIIVEKLNDLKFSQSLINDVFNSNDVILDLHKLFYPFNKPLIDNALQFILNINFNGEINTYYIHQHIVLKIEYFKILLTSFSKQNNANIIILHPEIGLDFIEFIYTNKFNVDYDNLNYNKIQSLLILADNYQIDSLYECCNKLLRMINI